MSGANPGRKKRSTGQFIGGVAALIVGVAAIVVGQGPVPSWMPFGGESGVSRVVGDTVTVTGTIGSEKAAFFKDAEVQQALAEEGLAVEFSTAGSRDIVNREAAGQDFLFPSSAPAGRAASDAREGSELTTPFYSPMVALTHDELVGSLQAHGFVRESGGHFYLSSQRLIEASREGVRWRDIAPEFPSPRAVDVTTTDVRTSNSAAMYAVILGWVANGENRIDSPETAQRVAGDIAPLVTGQGYTQASSAGPFERFLRVDKGEMPMVLAYEAQYLDYARHNPDHPYTVLYLDPTINSEHSLVALTEHGRQLADALATPRLQQLAAAHGFRPTDPAVLTTETIEGIPPVPAELISIPQPTFDEVEMLIAALT